MTKMLYDEKTGERIGLTNFDPVQIDTLGFQTLSEKVVRILAGEMDFHSNEKELEFDEEEGQWTDQEPDFDPTNDFLDKTDIHDLHKEIIEKQRELAEKVNNVTQIEPGEGIPKTSDPGTGQKSASESAPGETDKK